MEKIKKGLKITRITLWILTALFLLLQFVWKPFVYFAFASLTLAFVDLAILTIFLYQNLKKRIESGYDIYLVDCYNRGEISKSQFDEKDKSRFAEYSKMYKSDKAKLIALFILWFGLAVILLAILFKQIF